MIKKEKVNNKKILMLLIGNIKYDGRVQKEIYTLKSIGFDVELVITEFDNNDSFENYNYPITFIKKNRGGGIFRKIFNTIKFSFRVRKFLCNSNALYVHCHDINALMYMWGICKKKKVIYDSHELVIGNFTGINLKVLSFIESHLVKRCYKIIHTQIDRLNIFYFHYKSKLKHENLILLENWPMRNDKLSKTYFKDNYNYNQCKKILSYNGFIGEERNLEVVIRAMQKFDDLVFFIIGKGDVAYINNLKELVEKLGLSNTVYIEGPVLNSDVLHIANSSDLAVCFYSDAKMNSYFCASNKIYEYLNCGVKVLTNDIGGVSRVIKSRSNGYCLQEINEESIYEGLKALVLNEEQVVGNYYWENQIEKLKSIYL